MRAVGCTSGRVGRVVTAHRPHRDVVDAEAVELLAEDVEPSARGDTQGDAGALLADSPVGGGGGGVAWLGGHRGTERGGGRAGHEAASPSGWARHAAGSCLCSRSGMTMGWP